MQTLLYDWWSVRNVSLVSKCINKTKQNHRKSGKRATDLSTEAKLQKSCVWPIFKKKYKRNWVHFICVITVIRSVPVKWCLASIITYFQKVWLFSLRLQNNAWNEENIFINCQCLFVWLLFNSVYILSFVLSYVTIKLPVLVTWLHSTSYNWKKTLLKSLGSVCRLVVLFLL